MNESARVLLADDHAVLRAGLRLLLENQPGFEVVGEAATGLEALSLAAVQAVLRGEVYVHSSLTRILLEDMLPAPQIALEDAWERLSDREREVLRLVALGHTSAEIGDRLNLSPKTVETYRTRGATDQLERLRKEKITGRQS